MELKRILLPVWKWLWLIVLTTSVAASISYWNSSRQPRIYRTTTTLLVGQFTDSPNPQMQDFFASQQLARSYVELVRREPILQATIDTLGFNTNWNVLAGQVSAVAVAGTQLIQISVADTNPQRARIIADELANQLIVQSPTNDGEQAQHREFVNQQLADLRAKIETTNRQIRELERRLLTENSARAIQETQSQINALQAKNTSWQGNYANLLDFYKGGPRTNTLSIVEPAVIPLTPISPNVPMSILLAAAIGGIIGLGAAFLLEYLDSTVKTAEDVEHAVKLPTLGLVPRLPSSASGSDRLIALHHPRSHISEAYRVLRTNVQFSTLDMVSPRLVVTSPNPGEGKTTTIANLAVTLAQADKRVLLVDTDLRRPSIHRVFGIRNQFGLTNLLLDPTLPLDTTLYEIPTSELPGGRAGLWVLPSGPLPPNPADLLGSASMKQRLQQMQDWADIVLFDSPPVLAVADASIIGAFCNGVLLVVDAGRTRMDTLRQSLTILQRVGVQVVGVTLNKLKTRSRSGYYYYYSQAGPDEPSRLPRPIQALTKLVRRKAKPTPTTSHPLTLTHVNGKRDLSAYEQPGD